MRHALALDPLMNKPLFARPAFLESLSPEASVNCANTVAQPNAHNGVTPRGWLLVQRAD